MESYYQKAWESAEFLKKQFYGKPAPDIALVLGSGLSNAIPHLQSMQTVSYADIPNFKPTKVAGHAGSLAVGEIAGRSVAFLRGRNHAYEGHNPAEVVHNLRSLILWGVKGVVLTNASGCLNVNWKLGQMMLISDHINATGLSPLVGEFGREFGPQFVDMTCCYDKQWRSQFQKAAQECQQELYEGVYYGTLGCQYETPAEIRMMQIMGAQAVGMSTVLEAIAARQMGVKVAGLSCLTNYASGLTQDLLAHSDVMAMGARFAENMAHVILEAIPKLDV